MDRWRANGCSLVQVVLEKQWYLQRQKTSLGQATFIHVIREKEHLGDAVTGVFPIN
jgi:hypothetical protein